MKRKKMKPVRAWCLSHDGNIWPDWANTTRRGVEYSLGGKPLLPDERIIRVEIREVPRKKPARKP